MRKEEQAATMRKAAEWAKDGRLQAAFDRVISKLESGELSAEDLPPMPTKKIYWGIGRVDSKADAERVLYTRGLGDLDRFSATPMISENPDGSFDLLLQVDVGDDLMRCHFQLAHMISLFIRLNNETRGWSVHIDEIPEYDCQS